MVCRRFGTLYQFHLQGLDVKYLQGLDVKYTLHPALEDGTDRGFRNVGKPQSDAGEIPKRIHTRFKTRRKFEINKSILSQKHKTFVAFRFLETFDFRHISIFFYMHYVLNHFPFHYKIKRLVWCDKNKILGVPFRAFIYTPRRCHAFAIYACDVNHTALRQLHVMFHHGCIQSSKLRGCCGFLTKKGKKENNNFVNCTVSYFRLKCKQSYFNVLKITVYLIVQSH